MAFGIGPSENGSRPSLISVTDHLSSFQVFTSTYSSTTRDPRPNRSALAILIMCPQTCHSTWYGWEAGGVRSRYGFIRHMAYETTVLSPAGTRTDAVEPLVFSQQTGTKLLRGNLGNLLSLCSPTQGLAAPSRKRATCTWEKPGPESSAGNRWLASSPGSFGERAITNVNGAQHPLSASRAT